MDNALLIITLHLHFTRSMCLSSHQVNLEVDKMLREVKFLIYLTDHSIMSKLWKQEQYLKNSGLLLWVLMPTLLRYKGSYLRVKPPLHQHILPSDTLLPFISQSQSWQKSYAKCKIWKSPHTATGTEKRYFNKLSTWPNRIPQETSSGKFLSLLSFH